MTNEEWKNLPYAKKIKILTELSSETEAYEIVCDKIEDLPGELRDYVKDTPVSEQKAYNCLNHCPKCGAGENDIEWGEKKWGTEVAWQDAECNKCGCKFSEIYSYSCTEILDEEE